MKAFAAGLAFTCLAFVVCTSMAWVIAANIENPKIGYAKLDISPLIQGVDGPLTVQSRVQVNGTC